MIGGNISFVISKKTVSDFVPSKGVVRYTLPTIPTATAAASESITHVMAILVA
jgi:hypothetical protein